jgi:uncharacterized protein YjiS (DUF1127 family)
MHSRPVSGWHQLEWRPTMIIWATLLRRLRLKIAYRRTYLALSQLDDHMLSDIAVSRGQIGWVANRAAERSQA